MAKLIQIQCPGEIARIIIDALRWFVATRYPQAADECSIAAREALLDLAQRFQQDLLVDGNSAYSSRIRAFLCEAVKTYSLMLERNSGQSYEHRRSLLIKVCRGLSDGADWPVAAQADQRVGRDNGA